MKMRIRAGRRARFFRGTILIGTLLLQGMGAHQATLAQSRPKNNKPASPTKTPAKAKTPSQANPTGAAEVTGPGDLAGETANKAAPSPKVTTAAEALQVIDLRQLPRLNVLQLLDDSSTYVFYSAQGNVKSTMAFYESELSGNGWKHVANSNPVNPQYRDELFTKNGFYLRLNVGESADEGQISVQLANLGNVDLRQLPRMKGSQIGDYSTPVNASFQTTAGMREALQFCREELTKQGWREFSGMQPGTPEVPHVKQIDLIQNGVRIMVNIIRDPRLPSGDKTMVSYMAQHVLPYDLPWMADAKDLRLDTFSSSAQYSSSSSIDQIVAFYKDQAPRLNWTPETKRETIGEKSATLFMVDEGKKGFAISISTVPETGSNRVQMERVSLEAIERQLAANQSDSEEMEVEATESAGASLSQAEPDPTDLALQQLGDEIQNAVNRELQGVRSELNASGVPADVSKLVDEAQRIANILQDADEEDEDDEDAFDDDEDDQDDEEEGEVENGSSVPANATEAMAQSQAQADAQLATKGPLATLCRLSIGSKKYELKHAIAFRRPDDGKPIVMFCETPLNADKARRMLAKRETPSAHELTGRGFPASLMLELGDDFISLNCSTDAGSMSRGSIDFKSDYLAGTQRMRGTVTGDPEEVFGETFAFETSFDLTWLEKSASAAQASSADALVADANYDEPTPEGYETVSFERTPYHSTLTAKHSASIAELLTFYRRELTARGWKEDSQRAKVESTTASLEFRGPEGSALLNLKRVEELTEIALSVKNESKAQKDAIVPAKGQGLLLIANGTKAPITITLGKQSHKVAAGKGEQDPKDAFKIPVLPGKHRVKIDMGGETKIEEIVIQAGTSWGVFAVPDLGPMVQQLY